MVRRTLQCSSARSVASDSGNDSACNDVSGNDGPSVDARASKVVSASDNAKSSEYIGTRGNAKSSFYTNACVDAKPRSSCSAFF